VSTGAHIGAHIGVGERALAQSVQLSLHIGNNVRRTL
jgi:hypothetical protein